jgi:hypothetical protein
MCAMMLKLRICFISLPFPNGGQAVAVVTEGEDNTAFPGAGKDASSPRGPVLYVK